MIAELDQIVQIVTFPTLVTSELREMSSLPLTKVWCLYRASPQQVDLRRLGSPSGQGADGGLEPATEGSIDFAASIFTQLSVSGTMADDSTPEPFCHGLDFGSTSDLQESFCHGFDFESNIDSLA
ncbi:hypothetical protein PoB_004517200 [Plakobranchus ocellatus]|uniref:Uncharacterized protein n=1 Tax=Plakobranchus ocellatus TaxID=259542 RepID=A0AAV4BH04_9GAST|nr:hypothetical protein PoB_004517200 [Plakobranchus ocellatus]